MSRDKPAATKPDRVELRPVSELHEHPQAAEIPPPGEAERQALHVDIAARGIQTPLEVTREGAVLDGHARLRAARELGLREVPVIVAEPDDELLYMLLAALLRRQLKPSQKAALAVKLVDLERLQAEAAARRDANLRRGREGASLPAPEHSDPGRIRDRIAQLAGASARTVQDALTVHQHDAEEFERMLNGQVEASTAARRIRRELRDAALPAAPPLPEGPFELILADPPWQLGSPDSANAPEQHYPCLPTAEIKAILAPAADDCVLFLWAVNCRLLDAIEVVRAWGFQYRANIAWVKEAIGLGVWLRQRHELLLIATKGNISPPEPEDRCDSVVEAPRTSHSKKPEAVYELIERMYPRLSKLELFARNSRPGWTSWGNEVPDPEAGT